MSWAEDDLERILDAAAEDDDAGMPAAIRIGMTARIEAVDSIQRFVLAGDAHFTLVSTRTGTRFTYRVTQATEGRDGAPPHFVSVLTGPDNENDYSFLGTVFSGTKYFHGKKSAITPEAPSAKAFVFFWACLAQGALPLALEFWHEGRCGRCSRRLTTPASIAAGLGPECATKV